MMVANHTIGKEKYAEFEELNTKARDETSELRAGLPDGIAEDAVCFGKVTEAYRLPRRFSDLQMDRVSAALRSINLRKDKQGKGKWTTQNSEHLWNASTGAASLPRRMRWATRRLLSASL